MFHGKFVIVAEVQLVAKTQIITINVNMVDVNVTTKSKANEEHVFKDCQGKQKMLLIGKKTG
jgi:hypothetical protein